MIQFNDIYKNKRVLITGNSGFKGSWLSIWLNNLGAEVFGLSNGIPTKPSNFEVSGLCDKVTHFREDIRNFNGVLDVVKKIEPEFIFHLAAQPLVRKSYEDPRATLETNILGTTNILESLRVLNIPCACVVITSDKCYRNVEWIWGYRESDEIGGDDPYSASKGAAELVVKTYAHSFFNDPRSKVKVASARAGNVIGGGDWAEARIVPDAIKAWVNEKVLVIRSPHSTRPWQHVLEPLSGYLLLGKNLYENPTLNGEPFNFGPNNYQNFSVEQLLQEMAKYWENAKWETEGSDDQVKEAGLLKLNCDKSLHIIKWKPVMNFEETVEMVITWYHSYYREKNINMCEFSQNQINKFVEKAKNENYVWAK
jgi:CDP-glucose 4,6-dehydratase